MPKKIIFVSSTSVFGQEGLITAETKAEPIKPTAQVIRKTEQLLEQSKFPFCSVRFSGIYGPGRYHLLRQAHAGVAGGEGMTNRIHAEDCAAVVTFLIQRDLNGKDVPEYVLASDDAPVVSNTLRIWLRKEMALEGDLHAKVSGDKNTASKNRKIDNSALKSLGYRFIYPSYQDGFPELIQAFLNEQ